MKKDNGVAMSQIHICHPMPPNLPRLLVIGKCTANHRGSSLSWFSS